MYVCKKREIHIIVLDSKGSFPQPPKKIGLSIDR